MRYELQMFDNPSIDAATLVQRADRVAYMNVDSENKNTGLRMQGFTSMGDTKSPLEYSRRYVDEKTERKDVSGYSAEISFAFDRYSPFPVHESIAQVFEDELVGTDTHRDIIVVDFFDKKSNSSYAARKRRYSIIPNNSGDSNDALTYSGSFKAVGDPVKGTATVSDDGLTATFTEEGSVTPVPTPTTYTVTFDSDGGSAVEAQTVNDGATATEPTEPTKDSYTFGGWLLNGAAYDFSTPVTADITLVASWS